MSMLVGVLLVSLGILVVSLCLLKRSYNVLLKECLDYQDLAIDLRASIINTRYVLGISMLGHEGDCPTETDLKATCSCGASGYNAVLENALSHLVLANKPSNTNELPKKENNSNETFNH